MKEKLESFDVIDPINQSNLFGYNFFFNNLINLFKNKNISCPILLSGHKGLGKSTLAFHIANYLLSADEVNKYNNREIEALGLVQELSAVFGIDYYYNKPTFWIHYSK